MGDFPKSAEKFTHVYLSVGRVPFCMRRVSTSFASVGFLVLGLLLLGSLTACAEIRGKGGSTSSSTSVLPSSSVEAGSTVKESTSSTTSLPSSSTTSASAKMKTPTRTEATSTTTLPSAAGKASVSGLVDRKGVPSSYTDIVDVFVLNVAWSELQPESYGAIPRNNRIDDAVEQVRKLAESGIHLRIKLRLLAGIHAPEWVKALGGEPFAITEVQSTTGGVLGRFWLDEYGQAYQDLHEKLAVLYDDVPEILEVTMSRCTTVFAEPLIRHASDPDAIRNLVEAGYSRAADERCQREQIQTHAIWTTTRSGLALNPYQAIAPDGTVSIDVHFTEELASFCRDLLGSRCVLENNSIRWPPFEGDMHRMYRNIAQLGPPISFQTATPERVGDLRRTVEWAIALGANAVELPAGYGSLLSEQELRRLDSMLEANPLP